MTMTKMEKILLALVLGAAISTSAWAEDYTEQVKNYDDNVSYDDDTFTGSEAEDYMGGAIGNYGSITSITDSAFTGNSASLGGAIFNMGTIDSIENTTFSGNHVDEWGSGGAIHNMEGVINNIKNTVFTGNYTGVDGTGGAIMNDIGGSIGSIEGSTFTENKITGEGSRGGAISTAGDIGTIKDSDFSSNSSGDAGGAIFIGVESGDNLGSIGTITGCTFTGNESGTADSGAGGGAIFNTSTITEISDSTFTSNKAGVGDGGAISTWFYVESITGSIFEKNTAADSGGAIYNGTGWFGSEGQWVYVDYYGTIDRIEDSSFTSNEATIDGGAIYNYYYAKINSIKNDTFTGNTAQTGNGGAIFNYCEAYIDSIESSTFSGNTAGVSGGAIYNYWETEYGEDYGKGIIGDIKGSTFTNNSAGEYGGAIFNRGYIGLDEDGETETGGISGSTFSGNTSARGGAIYNGIQRSAGTSESDFDSIISYIDNCTFEKNVATAFGGAIYNFDDGEIITISNNQFLENTAENGNGGAIENAEAGSVIGAITNNYFYKNDVSESDHGGGAIYSEGIIDSISGNQFVENTSGNFGGAIYNNGGTIAGSGGAIEENYFYKNVSNRGGAFYNTVTRSVVSEGGLNYDLLGTNHETFDLALNSSAVGSGSIFSITGNTFMNNTANDYGGAIYNYHGGDIGEISDNLFYGNAANGGNGGAVENAEFDTSIGTMDNNNFMYNTAIGNGGAIYNQGTIGIDAETGEATEDGAITNSSFTGNSAANGGAIYNNWTSSENSYAVYFYDDPDNPSFSGEATKVEGAELDADGRALYTTTFYGAGQIGDITQSYFEGNKATNGSGGAIYNASTYDESTGETYTSTINSIVNTSFVNNSATEKGGAIYSTSDLTIVADGSQDGGDVVFSGNTAGSDDNAIYMASSADGETSTVTFSLSNEGTVMLADNIRGDDGYNVNITGDSTDTTFYLWNDVYYSNLSVGSETGNLTLHTINNDSHAYNINSFSLTGDFKMVADMDLYNGTMDRFVTYGEDHVYTSSDNANYTINGDSKLTVAGLNIISDANAKRIAVYFAEPGLMDSVHSDVGTLPGSEQQSVYSPVFTYDVNYIIYDDGDIHDEDDVDQSENYAADLFTAKGDGGYYVLDRTGINPAAMATSIAAMGAYSAFGLMFDYNFEHSDYFMKLPAEDRLALSEEQKRMKKAPKENDATKPAYYNQNELTERGAWMRAFAANESVDYGGGWESRDKYYGAMVGFDSNMHVSNNGWASVLTGYAGMLGIRQSYSGGNIRQKGGFVGLTESFYKKNFYTAWTIAAGTTKAHEYTMYGHDNSRLDEYGIAGRFGWNIPLGDGKFSLLPTFTASFTYINPEDYTNAGGAHISGDGFYAVQLNPNLKFIMNMENGWQPYLTVGEIWTFGETSKIYANGCKLDELDLDPYTEYGIGVQKRWANERDAYVQVLGHSHGRDGILVNAGIRWNF